MKRLIALVSVALLAPAFAADAPKPAAALDAKPAVHRYLIERTFPPGALAGLDAATKRKVNANNASAGVRWVQSYANADKTKTYCIYEGPSEAAVRKAAELNKSGLHNYFGDSVTGTSVTLSTGSLTGDRTTGQCSAASGCRRAISRACVRDVAPSLARTAET